jgi:Cap4 SAVED domain
MLITTNANDERKGSDGVHIRWTDEGLLEVIFAEAKLHKSFDAALTSAFVSMTDFHNSATKELEINYFLNTFTLLDAHQQEVITSYAEGENKGQCQEVHACLIGHTWKEYESLNGNEKSKFLASFEGRYAKWAEKVMRPKLEAELSSFIHSHLKFEFFFLPFTSVDNFRNLFIESL